jgi:hypothetical protein
MLARNRRKKFSLRPGLNVHTLFIKTSRAGSHALPRGLFLFGRTFPISFPVEK